MWSKVVDTDAVLGNTIQIRLLMTKCGAPSVRIGYEIGLERVP